MSVRKDILNCRVRMLLRYKIAENDLITSLQQREACKLKAKVTPRMPAGVVFAPYHFSAASG